MNPALSPILAFFAYVGEVAMLLGDVAKRVARRPFEGGETLSQMVFVGLNSIPIVAMTTFFSGAVLSLYTATFLAKYGASLFVGATVALSITREIAPVLAGIMVAARCGSAMAAQIGTMAVTEQIDALKMLSVHPTNYLVIPRVLACVLMMPILALVGMYAGIGGGMLVAEAFGVSMGTFTQSIRQYVMPWDFLGGIWKTPFFGLIIAIVACHQGLKTQDGAVGVGRATTRTVVLSMVLVYVANYFLASALFR